MSTKTPIFGFTRPSSDDFAYMLGDDMGATVDALESLLYGMGVRVSPDAAALAAEVTARANADATEVAARTAITTRLNTRCTVTGPSVNTTTAAPTVLPFTARTSRSLSSMWLSSTPTRLFAPVAGEYDLAMALSFAPSATGPRTLAYAINGGGLTYFHSWNGTTGAYNGDQTATLRGLELAAGAFVEVYAQQASGGTLATGPVRATLALAL